MAEKKSSGLAKKKMQTAASEEGALTGLARAVSEEDNPDLKLSDDSVDDDENRRLSDYKSEEAQLQAV